MSEHEIKKCFCLLIPKFTSKYWYFFWFLLGSLLRQSIPELIGEVIKKFDENKNDIKHPEIDKYFDMLANILSDLITGIFLLIFKNSENSDEQPKNKNSNSLQISFLFNDETNKTPLFRKLIFIISSLDLICQLIFLIKNIIFNELKIPTENEINTSYLYSLLIIDITTRYCFSRLILKTYFYAHHKLSFILNFFAFPFLLYVDIKKISQNDILNVFLTLSQYTLYSLEDIVDKVALETLFIIPTALLFYKGLYQLIPFIFISIICRFFHFIKFEKSYTTKLIITKLFFIPFNILRNVHLVKVIDIFTAQHMSHLRVWETLLLFIYTDIFNNFFREGLLEDKFEYILKCFSLVVLLISSLIHNEIIIINTNRFRSKTQYFLGRDAMIEQKNTGLDISDSRDITESSASYLYSDASSWY